MDPAAVGAAPAPVAAAEAQDAAASEASFRLAAIHSRLAYTRGGPSPQRTLRWDPQFAYPPVAAQNIPEALMNLLLQQAQAAGASPAGLHQGRGGGRGAGGGRGGGRGGVAQNALTPAQAQQALMALVAPPVTPHPEGAASFSLRFHRADLPLDPQSELGYRMNNTALTRARCPLLPCDPAARWLPTSLSRVARRWVNLPSRYPTTFDAPFPADNRNRGSGGGAGTFTVRGVGQG